MNWALVLTDACLYLWDPSLFDNGSEVGHDLCVRRRPVGLHQQVGSTVPTQPRHEALLLRSESLSGEQVSAEAGYHVLEVVLVYGGLDGVGSLVEFVWDGSTQHVQAHLAQYAVP